MSAPANITLVLSLAASPGTSGYKMHNAGYKALGIDYFYLPRKYEGDIAPALAAVRTLGIRGVGLTMPFKQSCLPYLDSLSQEAAEIGAVNTVVNDNGKLTGHNTDAPAAKILIEQHLPFRQHSLVILGTGGMAYAFAYAAKTLGTNASICARDTQKASVLAGRFGLKTLAWGNWDALSGVILCNATPMGMAGHEANPLADKISLLAGVFDAVASPADTSLIKAAKTAALPAVSGDMLSLEQACLQFELYTGKLAPKDVMRKALYD